MSKLRRSASFHLFFFARNRYWPLLLPSLAILFLIFCPQTSQSIQINFNDYNQQIPNSDRTVAKRGPRELQLTTASPPVLSSTPPTSTFDHLLHTLYVISLDGKITAIDAQANGRQLWTADTGSALVESSLSKIEISRDSRSVRLIPSLIGGLFEKYDEDGHVEPLPFDADALLDASFKLHDELVITGGKHIDMLGLDLHNGEILYSFAKDDSKQQNTLDSNRSKTADNNEERPTLIVKRTTQTVRARSARNGYEKWNFSVSNNELLHLHAKPTPVVLQEVNEHETAFSGYFEYQLQTGVVLAFDRTGHPIWSTAINAPIAAVWELKNGELHEKPLLETTTLNSFPKNDIDEEEEDSYPSPITSRRLAFIGEFNSTPYVLVSPRVQKQLIFDARKNNLAGINGNKRPQLSSWHKAYQKRTLSIGSELPENSHQHTTVGSASDHQYPLALRPDHQPDSSSSIVETCDTAGYLQLILNPNDHFIDEDRQNALALETNSHSHVHIPTITLAISSVFLGALLIVLIWCYKQKQSDYLREKSVIIDISNSTSATPPSTPDYHQLEPPLTPPFQSRYTLEYEHVRFLGRGGFGVVFEAINKLDERRVAIKRVSLKKASGKERALKEIRYLAVLNHPNLIQYYYAWNESPPIGWQEEEDKKLLVRTNTNPRDSLSTFPTSAASGNDSESINPVKLSAVSAIYAVKPSTISSPPLFEITFDRSSNPLRIDENFSANSINNNDKSGCTSSSSDDQSVNPRDSNNNTHLQNRLSSSTTTKSSLSSSSPFFDHSSDSSLSEKPLSTKETPGSDDDDDGIVFLHDEKGSSSSSSPIPAESKCSIEKVKTIANEKEIPTTYFYFVMELCQPESLRDRLIQRTIDRQQAWAVFDQIVRGIEYIHSQKLIHRDLKPSNILFSLDNTVKIGDFGLVSAFGEDKLAKKKKRDEDRSDLIQSTSSTTDGCGNNELGGTILYMSPEQMNRKPYNQKVDIYAMGIILFELLYPFSTQMERMQAIANVRLHTPVFPKDFDRDGTNRNQLICRLIQWLLSYTPGNRPRAGDLRQDTFYQRMLQMEVPHLFCPDNRQQNTTIVGGQEQNPVCTQRGRVSSSPFRRTLSSSALQSLRDSESGDIQCAS